MFDSMCNILMSKVTKTEHSGAKNGGGYWGLRAIAKQHSKKRRRWFEKSYYKAGKENIN